MNISGLTMRKISAKMESYVRDYLDEIRVTNAKGEPFTESHLLGFEEIDLDLPQANLCFQKLYKTHFY